MASILPKGSRALLSRSPTDVVILSALRTPITRAYKGGQKDTHDHELLYHTLRATLSAVPDLSPSLINEVCIGTVLSELGGSKAGRMASLAAGLPATSSFGTMNRACASGLSAVTSVASSIALGMADVGIGGGMESMSRNYGTRAIPTGLWEGLRDSEVKEARDCVMPMGSTAENVASRYGVSREAQDVFAAESQARAAAAQEAGLFGEEIVPVRCTWTDPKVEDAEAVEVLVERDDGVRKTSVQKLAAMKPAFSESGTATAGNSSQISDGAAAVLLARRSTAEALGLEKHILGRWAGTATVGCAPDEMGIGPALAVPKLLDVAGIETSDGGLWEINEAFASQAVYCLRELGLEGAWEQGKVNPKGGAIALGHPLGATGARMIATLLPELQRQQKELGVVSMCVGTGMGQAMLIVRE